MVTALIQPMDKGVIMVLVIVEEEEDAVEDTRGLSMLNNIKAYKLRSALYNFSAAWKKVKILTLANCWEKLLLDDGSGLDFEGFEPLDFHSMLHVGGEGEVTLEVVRTGWRKQMPIQATKSSPLPR